MSSVSTSRPRKSDPLGKRIPENPKYKHVKATVDTGASITKYMEKIDQIRQDYRYKNDEIFKRMKVTTFVQLVVQVARYDDESSSFYGNGTDRPATSDDAYYADKEVDRIQRGGAGDRSPAPSLALTEGDFGAPAVGNNGRSTLQRVIKGEGELSGQKDQNSSNNLEKKVLDGCPYLLLDVREPECFDQCHIITAKNYPKAMLSRATNYESKDMLTFKNQPGKIIIVYDETEQIAHGCVTTLVQRGYDNIFLLSGGMKVAYKIFPEGLFSGTPSLTVSDTPRSNRRPEMADRNTFTTEDLDKIEIYLDNALCDKSSGSRLSKASTAASRMSNSYSSSKGYKTPSSVASGRASHQAPFK